MTKTDQLLLNCRKFLLDYFKYGEYCKTEAINFLNSYLQLLIISNGLSLENSKCVFHTFNDNKLPFNAYVNIRHMKDKSFTFDIYLKNEFLNSSKRLNNDQLITINKNNKNLVSVLQEQYKLPNFLFQAGHEFQHIVQTLVDPDYFDELADKRYSYDLIINQAIALKNKDKDCRTIIKNLISYKNAKCANANKEVDADESSIVYAVSMIKEFIDIEKDEKIKEFLLTLMFRLTKIQKSRKYNYFIADKITEQSIQTLKRFDFTENDLINY